MKIWTIALAVLFLSGNLATSVAQDATVTVKGKKLFTQKSSVETKGDMVTRTTEFYDMSGKLALRDMVTYNSKSLTLEEGRQENMYTGALETIKHKGDKKFSLSYKENANSKLKEETITEKKAALKGLMIGAYVQGNMASFLSGKEHSIRMLVPSRLESIGFDLQKDRMDTYKGKSCVVIKMRASSWIIRQLVDELYFWFEKEAPHRLLFYQGRLTPTDKDGKMMDGEVEYSID